MNLALSLASPPNFMGRVRVSPLVLADRLITLAQDADRAGYQDAAIDLVDLAYSVLDKRTPALLGLPGATEESWVRPIRKPSRQAGQLRRAHRGARSATQAQA